MATQQWDDVSSIRFIVGVFVREVGHKIATAPAGDPINLDDEVLHMDALISEWVEKDDRFLKEWRAVQDARLADARLHEDERQEAVAFRYMEWKAQVRAAIRCGLLYKTEPPKTSWNPKELTAA